MRKCSQEQISMSTFFECTCRGKYSYFCILYFVTFSSQVSLWNSGYSPWGEHGSAYPGHWGNRTLFDGGGNRSTRRKPPVRDPRRKSLLYGAAYLVPRAGIEPTPCTDIGYRPVSQTRRTRREPLGHHVGRRIWSSYKYKPLQILLGDIIMFISTAPEYIGEVISLIENDFRWGRFCCRSEQNSKTPADRQKKGENKSRSRKTVNKRKQGNHVVSIIVVGMTQNFRVKPRSMKLFWISGSEVSSPFCASPPPPTRHTFSTDLTGVLKSLVHLHSHVF
jgi:hypothetical protein